AKSHSALVLNPRLYPDVKEESGHAASLLHPSCLLYMYDKIGTPDVSQAPPLGKKGAGLSLEVLGALYKNHYSGEHKRGLSQDQEDAGFMSAPASDLHTTCSSEAAGAKPPLWPATMETPWAKTAMLSHSARRTRTGWCWRSYRCTVGSRRCYTQPCRNTGSWRWNWRHYAVMLPPKKSCKRIQLKCTLSMLRPRKRSVLSMLRRRRRSVLSMLRLRRRSVLGMLRIRRRIPLSILRIRRSVLSMLRLRRRSPLSVLRLRRRSPLGRMRVSWSPCWGR
ncbi:hypothetical protein AAFF_G00039200, partial [Aldrovandia affinis]